MRGFGNMDVLYIPNRILIITPSLSGTKHSLIKTYTFNFITIFKCPLENRNKLSTRKLAVTYFLTTFALEEIIN